MDYWGTTLVLNVIFLAALFAPYLLIYLIIEIVVWKKASNRKKRKEDEERRRIEEERARKEELAKQEEEARRKEFVKLDGLVDRVSACLKEQDAVLDNSAGYLMKKTWDSVLSESKGLYDEFAAISLRSWRAHPEHGLFEKFGRRHTDPSVLDRRNRDFKAKEIARCRALFDDVEGHPLDAQQRNAIVTDEYNNLVIAGAGSGKTVTVLGKVRYLIEYLGVKPEEILLMSFTRKSVDDLRMRLERAGIEGVHCRTFHSLGLNQLSGTGVANDNELDMCISSYLKNGIKAHPEQASAYLEFYGCYKHVPKDYDEYDDPGQRYRELKASDLVTIKGKLDTLQGERVKSMEELMIANFLYLHGIDYEYEKNYSGEYQTNGRAYQPDFYLVDYDIWLEHFGISEDGRVPWLENPIKEQEYLDGILWKRQVHAENGTRLIESYSFWNADHDLLNKLESLLLSNGVAIETDPEFLRDTYEKISSEDRYLSSMTKLIKTFLCLAKANRIGMAEAWELGRAEYAGDGYMWHRFELFMTFTEPIMAAYAKRLEENGKIDFDDMINKAADKIRKSGMEEAYRYIIVDEYQDISRSRFELVKAIRDLNGAKLMCVGDDWQSIYRFAGSDISLFTHFSKYVGYTEMLKIETTYRNSQELVDIASEFIEANPAQVHKAMKSKSAHVEHPLIISQLDDPAEAFEYALEQILGSREGYDGEILVLGRHNADIERIYPGLAGNENLSFRRDRRTGDVAITFRGYDRIRYMSVHRSKGLEADDVVVLNMVNDMYGFPNRLEDDPMLQILLGDEEDFDFAEERRLFYVAITRTRNTTYLISCSSDGNREPSPFVNELKQGSQAQHILITTYEGQADEWNPVLCPRCGSGRLTVRTNSETGAKFLGCTNYPFCTETYGNIEIVNDQVRCPTCGDWMVRRRRKSDGAPFFGCSNFPKCRTTFDADENHNLVSRFAEAPGYTRPQTTDRTTGDGFAMSAEADDFTLSNPSPSPVSSMPFEEPGAGNFGHPSYPTDFSVGDTVNHKTFGRGTVRSVDGNCVVVYFEKLHKTKKLLIGYAPMFKEHDDDIPF